MKKLAIVFIGFFLMAFSVNVNAQNQATTNPEVPTSAKIVEVINISLTNAGLDFGTLVPTGTDGEVEILADGTQRNTSNVDVIGQENSFSNATFNVTGEEGLTFKITAPDAAYTTQLTSTGNDPMTVKDFTFTVATTNNTINAGGTPFGVGATLEVAGNQGSGIYEGTFPVTVQYE